MKRKKLNEENDENIEKELKSIISRTKNESIALNKILIQLKVNKSVSNKKKGELENKKITNT